MMLKRLHTLALYILVSCGIVFARDDPQGTIAQEDTFLANISELLAAKWPNNRTINIVCHGHSVPAGYFKTPLVNTFNAYPHLLHRALKQRYPHAIINVIVTSIGGESSDRGAERFEREVLNHHPDLITIDYALNDRRIGLGEAKTAWSSMIKSAKEHGVKVILLTPTGDIKSNGDDPSDPLNQHADQIRALAKEHHVALADSLAAFHHHATTEGEIEHLMSQGNHPNRRGHDLVIGELMEWFPQ